MLSIDPD